MVRVLNEQLPILSERTPALAILRLNRPEKLNALTNDIFEALGSELSHLEDDNDLRAVILTGAGERAFCAGTDINELRDADASMLSERGQQLCDRVKTFRFR